MICPSTSQDELKLQTASQVEMTEASATERWKEAVSLCNMGSSSESRVSDAKLTNVANTLLSRDYKGLSNYASNGVIEWKSDN